MRELGIGDDAVDAGHWAELPPMLEAALPPACVSTLAAVVRCRDGGVLDLVRLAICLRRDRDGVLDAVNEAETAFHAVFAMHVLPPHRQWFDETEPGSGPSAEGAGIPDHIRMGSRFLDLLDRDHAAARPVGPAPVVGGDTAAWIAAIATAIAVGEPLHLALRCRSDGDRDRRDLAALLLEAGVGTIVVKAYDRALAAGC